MAGKILWKEILRNFVAAAFEVQIWQVRLWRIDGLVLGPNQEKKRQTGLH